MGLPEAEDPSGAPMGGRSSGGSIPREVAVWVGLLGTLSHHGTHPTMGFIPPQDHGTHPTTCPTMGTIPP